MLRILALLLFFGTSLVAQERISLYGSITGPGNLENIHVLNKNSSKGTISNEFGRFQLAVQPNDTLIVTGIQFYYQEIIITEQHIKNKTIPVNLLQRINELDEVTVKSHNLSGNLSTDAANAKMTVSKVNKGALSFGNLDVGAAYVGPIDEVDRRTPPDPFGGNHGVPGFESGGDIMGLLNLVLNPVFKGIKNIGKEKRENAKREKNQLLNETRPIDLLAKKYTEYLIEDLNIPADLIYPFIEHCQSKDILGLFNSNRQIEVLDLLIKEAEIFLESIKKN